MTTVTIQGVEHDLNTPIAPEYRDHADYATRCEFTLVTEAIRKVFSALVGGGVRLDSSRGRMIKALAAEITANPHVSDAISAAQISMSKAESLVSYMPANFIMPSLEADGSVKAGIRYRDSMLVLVESKSNGGRPVNSFIGMIESVGDDNLNVRVLMPAYELCTSSHAIIIRNSIVIDGTRHSSPESRSKVVRKSVVVSKRHARIINPYVITPMQWATLDLDLRLTRYSRTRESHLTPNKDPRFGSKKWNYTQSEFQSFGSANLWRLKGKVQSQLISMMVKGDDSIIRLQTTSEIDMAVRKIIAKHMTLAQKKIVSSHGMSWLSNFISCKRELGCAIDRFNSKYAGEEHIAIMMPDACGHYEREGRQVEVYHGSSRRHVCSVCAASDLYSRGLDAAGNTVLYSRTHGSLIRWSDGTMRVVGEPPVVGSYHSSKALNREVKLPPEAVPYAPSGLTMGIELEMESAEGDINEEDQRTRLARLVLSRMVKAQALVGMNPTQRYGYFERDGSVSNGFELVSGWGELAMHQHFIRNIFGMVDGEDKLPFIGKLRSHDASASCGLHVHLAKPKTLTHAVKLQSFYNSPENKRLIHSVARRYDVSYTKVVRNLEKERVPAQTRNALDGTGYRLSQTPSKSSKATLINRAIRSLSSERYQAVNFTPEKTVEIRIFKGSMLPNTILACIEFAHASWFFTRDMPANKITSDEFLRYIADPCRRHETPHLRAYLAARGYVTYLPRFREGVTEVVEHDFNSSNA